MKQTSQKYCSLTVLRLALTLGFLVALPVGAADQPEKPTKKYPPYPDVWGYELPWPHMDSRAIDFRISPLPDGDYLLTYIKKEKKTQRPDGTCCKHIYEFARLTFFGNEKADLSNKEHDELSKQRRDVSSGHLPLLGGKPMIFRDGSTLTQESEAHNRCYVFAPYAIVIKGPDGKVVAKKRLFYRHDKARRVSIDEYCELSGNRDFVEEQLEPVYSAFVRLEDDSFLLFDSSGNFIVRFTKDFTTKFPVGDHIVLVDESVIKDITAKAKDVQEANDLLAVHVTGIRSSAKSSNLTKESTH